MVEMTSNPANILMIVVAGLNLTTLWFLFLKHIDGQPLINYQPRRRVPWGPLVAMIGMGLPLLSLVHFFASVLEISSIQAIEEISVESFFFAGAVDCVLKISFFFCMVCVLVAHYRADVFDLGLPTSVKQFIADVSLGSVACVAVILPINLLQFTLVHALDSNTPHPLIEKLETEHSPEMLLVAFVMAVIVAPLFEEFTFRGLLQGWLERREDEVLGYDATRRRPATAAADTETAAGDLASEDSAERRFVDQQPRPLHGWLPDLPHGWTPILISGFAFGLAHVGHGVAPIPLVVFGIVLGYLYQRTHRLTPCITAHMLFNGYSMILLWLHLETASAG